MFGLEGSPLVDKLVEGEHAVEICTRSQPDEKRQDLIRQIGYDLVHIRFPNTKGGTELGVRLQRDLCQGLDLASEPSGEAEHLKVVGDLTLDWVPIRVTAELSLASYSGTAHVDKREES